MAYKLLDTTSETPGSFELKADGEARPSNDGTPARLFSDLSEADAAAKQFPGMSPVDTQAGE